MTGAQYIVDCLVRRGVTDAFGIPGGVLLKLIYEMDERKGITPHLSYHEQAAGFAACGYAQASGKLGVAYGTRGPGFTNLITAIADAYYDSLPVLFITAHAAPCPPEGMRVMADQEMDTCAMVENITKMAVRADDINMFAETIERLCETAVSGRKGPVLLDVSSKLLSVEIPDTILYHQNNAPKPAKDSVIADIVKSINAAKRPVILIGDGISQAGARELLRQFVEQAGVPVISSRFSHDVMGGSLWYFGYVGSHGMRCANFMLSKCDLIVALGNRMHFPVESQTFSDIFSHARLIRCEIDKGEFLREIPNASCHQCDVAELLKGLISGLYNFGSHQDWFEVCQTLRDELKEEDMNDATRQIADIIRWTPKDWAIVNDVGNNEFWVSRASVYCEDNHRTYYSKSFGALGCGIGKAIGIHYATGKAVLCFTGDQGIQMNIQELQFIAQLHLPILIVLINNGTSGMIKDRENSFGRYLHTTYDSGFRAPSWRGITEAYGIRYVETTEIKDIDISELPCLLGLKTDENIALTPSLPRGASCQDLKPSLPKEKYDYLNNL